MMQKRPVFDRSFFYPWLNLEIMVKSLILQGLRKITLDFKKRELITLWL